jgi:hypothetical protein
MEPRDSIVIISHNAIHVKKSPLGILVVVMDGDSSGWANDDKKGRTHVLFLRSAPFPSPKQ